MVARKLSERGGNKTLEVLMVNRAFGRAGIKERLCHGAGENGVVRRKCARRENDELFGRAAEVRKFVAGAEDIACNGADKRHKGVLRRRNGRNGGTPF